MNKKGREGEMIPWENVPFLTQEVPGIVCQVLKLEHLYKYICYTYSASLFIP